MGAIFHTIITTPLTNALLFFNYLFSLLNIPGAFGFSIIAVTFSIRILLHPMYVKQMALSKKIEELKPHLDKLSEKHKNDKKKLQEEQIKLYKERGINPASGCLFALVQIPIFIGLYQVLILFLSNGGMKSISSKINSIVYFPFLKVTSIDPWFFGFNLFETPSKFSSLGYHYLLVPIITAILQYLQTKYTIPSSQKTLKNKEKDDISSVMSSQMKIMFPLMIGYFSFMFPVGLALYWNMFSIISLIATVKKK